MKLFNLIKIFILGLGFFLIFFACQTQSPNIRDEQDVEERTSPQQASKSESKLIRLSGLTEWNTIREGFLDSSTFQVKVSSLKTSRPEAMEEALDVAKRKCLRMLAAEANPNLSNDGRVDLKILIEEYGKIVSETDFVGEKYHFVFQVKRPALEIIIKEKLK